MFRARIPKILDDHVVAVFDAKDAEDLADLLTALLLDLGTSGSADEDEDAKNQGEKRHDQPKAREKDEKGIILASGHRDKDRREHDQRDDDEEDAPHFASLILGVMRMGKSKPLLIAFP